MKLTNIRIRATAGIAVGIAALGVVIAPSAFAGSVTCTVGAGLCSTTYNYTGGATQAKITVDYGGSSKVTARGFFYNPNGSTNCYFDIRPVDPPKTFYCNWSAGTGTYKAGLPNYGNTFPTKVTLTHS